MGKSKKQSLIAEYLDIQEEYEQKYDPNSTIVFMQVGSFFEAYATNERGFDLMKLSDLLNIRRTKKNKKIKEVSVGNPYVLGFPTNSFDKYYKVLIQSQLTVVLIKQVTPPPNPKRELIGVFSQGTAIDQVSSPDSNNIVCIYLEEEKVFQKEKYFFSVGLSVIDLSTGRSVVHEVQSPIDDENYALDEIIRFVSSYQPKEIILHTVNFKKTKEEKVLSYLELDNQVYYHNMSLPKNVYKNTYQDKFFKKVFPETGMLSPVEYLDLELNNYARISYLILLQYAFDHVENLIENLHKPDIYQGEKYLHLGNNALFQLDILDSGSAKKSHIKSVFDVVNKTSTPMGRRYLRETLINPIIDPKELTLRYEIIEKLSLDDFYLQIDEHLKQVQDIERLHRKISLESLHPCDFVNLHHSYLRIEEIIKLLQNSDLKFMVSQKMYEQFKEFQKEYYKIVNLDEAQKYLMTSIETSIFQKGVRKSVDKIQVEIDEAKSWFEELCYKLNQLVVYKKKAKKNKNYFDEETEETEESEPQFIRISFNENNKYHPLIQASALKVLKGKLPKSIEVQGTTIKTDFSYKKIGIGVKILSDDFIEPADKWQQAKEKMMKISQKIYQEYLQEFYQKYHVLFTELADFTSKIDFLCSGTKVALLNRYCKPEILEGDKDKSYIDCQQLRHPIIEKLIDVEYVPHDISLGTNTLDGILLFGLNAVGKSSLQKAIGISIILAQIGYYVPAKNYQFFPYKSLFTRITGQDNLFRGLSSFTLEITELRAILKRFGSRTMVIADEVCKGTEHKSSKVIVLAMIEMLAKSRTSFITATHLHEIVDTQRLKSLETVKCFHLHVEIDKENDRLIYDRELREGSGPSEYGLAVAKYIIDDSDFMNLAIDIMKELNDEEQFLISDKTSRYNSKIFMTECTVCQAKDNLEAHHILQQKDTDEQGFLLEKPHVHKDHQSNLVVLCEKCHDDIHAHKIVINGYKETSKGLELEIIKPKKKKKVSKYDETTKSLVLTLKERPNMTQKRAKELMWEKHGIKVSQAYVSKIFRS